MSYKLLLALSTVIFSVAANASIFTTTSPSPIGSAPNEKGKYQVEHTEISYNSFRYVSSSPSGSAPDKSGQFVYQPTANSISNDRQHYISYSPIGSLPNRDGKHQLY